MTGSTRSTDFDRSPRARDDDAVSIVVGDWSTYEVEKQRKDVSECDDDAILRRDDVFVVQSNDACVF